MLMTALRTLLLTWLVAGVVYPLAMAGVARLLFPRQSGGSLVAGRDGADVGSELLAQRFVSPAYFQPRPSAAGAGYDAAASGGSNLGPTSRALRERVTRERDRLLSENPGAPGPVPVELVTASGSGLDPHLTPEAAAWQVPRVARVRGLPRDAIAELIRAHTAGPDLGVLGCARVNVLLLNLALDRAAAGSRP